MKKTVLMLVACVVMLAQFGCSKETKSNPDNPGESGGGTEEQEPTGSLIPYFDLAEELHGMSPENAKSKLTGKGWTYVSVDDEYEPAEYVFENKNETSAYVQLRYYVYTKASNKVCGVNIKFTGLEENSYLTNKKVYLNLMKYVGRTYTLKSGKVYTFIEDDFSYDELISNFSSIYERDFWRAMWKQSKKDNGTIYMYKYTYSFEMDMCDVASYRWND